MILLYIKRNTVDVMEERVLNYYFVVPTYIFVVHASCYHYTSNSNVS